MLLKADILDNLTQAAKDSPRLRMNYNLHESLDDSVQRLFNAIEPGSQIPVARHMDSNETLILIRGKLKVEIFNDQKEVIETCILDKAIDNIGYHIEKGKWHCVQSLESGTILFETREGPYVPISENDILI